MGIMRGQMSESSQTGVYETTVGKQAVNETDPKKLLESIIATHSGDSRLRPNHHLFIIEQRYSSMVMGAHEEVAQYYQAMRSTLSAIEQAYIRAGKNLPDDKYPEDQMGIKFTLGLNHHYDDYKYHFVNNLRPWPESLEEAHNEAVKFLPNRKVGGGGSPAAFKRANAFAYGKGRGGGRGAYSKTGPGHKGKSTHGADSDSEKGSPVSPTPVNAANATPSPPGGNRRGICNNCNKPGHYSYQCTEEPQYWKEDPKHKSPQGRGTPPNTPGKGKL